MRRRLFRFLALWLLGGLTAGAIVIAAQRQPPPQTVGQTYMLQGEMTYHQDGKPDVVIRAGDGFAEGRATTHWGENTGTGPAVWIAVDIPRP